MWDEAVLKCTMYPWVQKRVQSSAAEQTGTKLHRWSQASASAKGTKNKLGMLFRALYTVSQKKETLYSCPYLR